MREPIRPRRVGFDCQRAPVHWLDGRPGLTHMANALHLLFPPGERWFAQVGHRLLPRLRDPQLIADVKGFMGQEGHHARSHETFRAVLAAQGFRVERVSRLLEADFRRLGHLPLALQIAVVSGVEHYTAALGRMAFDRGVFEGAYPPLLDLFLWHCAEELEHKSVAFDLRQATAPGYLLRVAGMLIATIGLLLWWTVLMAVLIRQDPGATTRTALRDLARAQREGKMPCGRIARGFLRYLRPGFHPSEDDDLHYARAYLARSPAVAASRGTDLLD